MGEGKRHPGGPRLCSRLGSFCSADGAGADLCNSSTARGGPKGILPGRIGGTQDSLFQCRVPAEGLFSNVPCSVMNRRVFLVQLVLSALAPLLFQQSGGGSEASSDVQSHSFAPGGIVDLEGADGRGMRHFGRHVVSNRSLSADQAEVALCEYCGEAGVGALTAVQLRERHRQDLEDGNLVCVDRVYLSETEARLCAVVHYRDRRRTSTQSRWF